MKDSFEIFLLVAKNLSFTKTAKQAFVTQQTVSYHIQNLENKYNVKLFNRKPTLSLTDAGKILYDNLRNMKSIETSMEEQISELKGESIGELRVGLNTVRARILLPEFLPEYINTYPKVKTSFFMYDTYILSEMLLNNKIDMFIGVETKSNKNFIRKKLRDEKIFLIATRNLLKNFKHYTDIEIQEIKKDGINLKDLNKIPTIKNLISCSFNNVINNNISKYDIYLPEIINCSDYDIQINMSAKNLGIAFCPSLILYKVIEHNKKYKNTEQELLILKIKDIKERLRIDVVTSSIFKHPKFLDVFTENLFETANEKYNELDKFLENYFNS